jgi:3-methyladenine DNA glycosylase AlkD
MSLQAILDALQAQQNPANVEGMAHFSIRPGRTVYGVPVNTLREMAKPYRRNHALALQLWESGSHEARILASIIDDPKQVTEAQMEAWAASFDSWDICDQCCTNLFSRTPFAYARVGAWSEREEEFVKRAAFTLMANLAVHDKKAPDSAFEAFLPILSREAADGRNFVKKAVNWALRGIGKRNAHLNALAVQTAERLRESDSKAARWVANDALRELTGDKVRAKLGLSAGE